MEAASGTSAAVLAAAGATTGTTHVPADLAVERVWLDDRSWVDVARRWLPDTTVLFDALAETVPWRQGRIWRYERWVDEPRLSAWCPVGSPAAQSALVATQRTLEQRYRVRFDGYALAQYRSGRDSVAFHRDRELRWLDDTVIAVLTLGARRSFLLRPRSARFDHERPGAGATHDLAPAAGDLLVMGGRCQADWEHAVPKVGHRVGVRISVQWRWTSRRGRREGGASYRAPRRFTR